MRFATPKFNFKLSILASFALFFFLVPLALAQRGPDPTILTQGIVQCGRGQVPCDLCDLYAGTRRVMNFLLWYLALPALVIAILAAGIMYLISGGSPAMIANAKTTLQYAVIGFLLAFGAWVIVNTILTTLGFKGDWASFAICQRFGALITAPTGIQPSITQPPVTPLLPPGTFQSEQEARNVLVNAGIPIKDPCPAGQTQDCVNLAGLPKSTAQKLVDLKNRCGNLCPFRISGGTEPGHQTHGIGRPAVDIVPLNQTPTAFSILRQNAAEVGGVARCERQGGTPTNCGPGTNHVHVAFL